MMEEVPHDYHAYDVTGNRSHLGFVDLLFIYTRKCVDPAHKNKQRGIDGCPAAHNVTRRVPLRFGFTSRVAAVEELGKGSEVTLRLRAAPCKVSFVQGLRLDVCGHNFPVTRIKGFSVTVETTRASKSALAVAHGMSELIGTVAHIPDGRWRCAYWATPCIRLRSCSDHLCPYARTRTEVTCHPALLRTQMCAHREDCAFDGTCSFAHSPDQLRKQPTAGTVLPLHIIAFGPIDIHFGSPTG
jgi:hypothetical protein